MVAWTSLGNELNAPEAKSTIAGQISKSSMIEGTNHSEKALRILSLCICSSILDGMKKALVVTAIACMASGLVGQSTQLGSQQARPDNKVSWSGRGDLDTSIGVAIAMLEKKDYRAFILDVADRNESAKMKRDGVDKAAEDVAKEKAAFLLGILRKIRGSRPKLVGDTATYRYSKEKDLVWVKDDGVWYIRIGSPLREWTEDKHGHRIWKPWPAPMCKKCDGTGVSRCKTCAGRVAVSWQCPECRFQVSRPRGLFDAGPGQVVSSRKCGACAGKGVRPDPLDKALCAACQGRVVLSCTVCLGKGINEEAGDVPVAKCEACDGAGSFACILCDGVGLIDTIRVWPTLREANQRDLRTALEACHAAFLHVGEINKSDSSVTIQARLRTLGRAYKAMQRYCKVLRPMSVRVSKHVQKMHVRGKRAGRSEAGEEAFSMLAQNLSRYLAHQEAVLEIAIKRLLHPAEK